ncbi:hypothetical protein BDW75DRAFT_223747 [Aspergillus navahoensis]
MSLTHQKHTGLLDWSCTSVSIILILLALRRPDSARHVLTFPLRSMGNRGYAMR